MNSRKRFRVFFGICTLLIWSLGCQFVTSVFEHNNSSSCYKVSFLGFDDHEDDTSTWHYQVDELSCAQDLSNWMLELPACAIVLDASPSPWEVVHPDPNYHLDGIKWQTGAGFESGEFNVTVSGDLTSGTVLVGVKGPDVEIFSSTGPVCDMGTVTLTETLDLTASPSPEPEETETPSPIPPTETPEQPPASSGSIIITDNDQTLTFTCNGNAVEVRGNANTVTLLGSCGSITVKGNGNTIYYSGSPAITNTGNENNLIQR
jgi:hypothetical protein